jgi:hypothetical protein
VISGMMTCYPHSRYAVLPCTFRWFESMSISVPSHVMSIG